MKYFEFLNTVKICSGENALVNVVHELKFFNASRPLILSGENLKKIGTLKNVLKIFSKNGLDVERVFTNIPVDSSTDTINEIAKLFKELNPDSLVAIGGGSIIDTAKGVKLLLSQQKENIFELEGNEILNQGILIPTIIIPTTCGTGSECTSVAVIKNSKTNVKMEFISPVILPNVAVLDPMVLETLPPKLVATTAIDALTHAIEAYSCLQKNVVSSAFATSAIKLVSTNLFLALSNPKKSVLKLNLLNASMLAGIAFSNSMVGIVHAIGHSLGAHGIAHGNAMAILLASCLKFNLDVAHTYYSELLLHFKGPEFFANTPEENRAKTFVLEVEQFVKHAAILGGFSLKLKDYGVTKNMLNEIAALAVNDGASALNPKLFTKNDVIAILEECL